MMASSGGACSHFAFVAWAVFALLLTQGGDNVVDARRNQGNQRKTSSSSSSSNYGHVTPSYSTNGHAAGNSHADVAKLSYPNYNSQPNRPMAAGSSGSPGSAPQPGWNVPQGPPPAYSASNPVGGARPNMHEPPPSYHAPNYGAAPPNYGAATGSNMHQPQYSGVPAGATYYPAAGHGGSPNIPAGATYYPSAGHVPMGGGYHPAAAPPPGATYYQAGSALPPGATYYSAPPQQSSSGLGFGTGLLAGGLGGALLGHALTPSGGSSSSQPVAAAPAAGQDRIIIINNGVPVNASDGTTVINAAGVAAAPGAVPAAPIPPTNMTQDAQQPAVSMAPMPAMPFNPETSNMTAPEAAAPPPPGGIICVPTKVNETDPTDSTKMIEVEKIACYPAPPPPAASAGEGPAPLAPMAADQPGSQQVQKTQDVAAPIQASVTSNTGGAGSLEGLTIRSLLLVLMSGVMAKWLAGF